MASKPSKTQQEYFNGRAHVFTRDDCLKGVQARRRKAEERKRAAEALEQRAQERALDPRMVAAYPEDTA